MNKVTMFFKTVFACICFLFFANDASTQSNSKPLNIGVVQTLYSSILKEDRALNIYLPAGYDSSKKYPVLYLLDGSMDEDFLHIVGLCQFFNLMFEMREVIIVGIANVDRKRDFTFATKVAQLKKEYPTTGHSDVFISFIENELQPFVRKHYAVNDTGFIIGQSLGGLLATEILCKKPQLFTHYFIVSPSLWWDNGSLLKDAPGLLATQNITEKYVYVSAGKKEDAIMQRHAQQLFQLLQKSKGIKKDFRLMPDEDHATILHRSIYQAFLLLFKPRY